MREAGEIAEAMNGQRDELKQVSAKLSKLLVDVVTAAKAKLGEETMALESARIELARQQAAFLSELMADKRSLDEAKRDLDQLRENRAQEKSDLLTASRNFARAVNDFERLTIWERIFMPASLKTFAKKHSKTPTLRD